MLQAPLCPSALPQEAPQAAELALGLPLWERGIPALTFLAKGVGWGWKSSEAVLFRKRGSDFGAGETTPPEPQAHSCRPSHTLLSGAYCLSQAGRSPLTALG